jgi:hypothetical protein
MVVLTYGYAREAERSVDAVLGNKWSELTDYYQPKTAALTSLTASLQNLLPRQAGSPRSLTGEEIGRAVSPPGLVAVLFGSWIARWKSTWRFSDREVAFLISTLNTLLEFLKKPESPSREELIALRRELYVCEYLIECRCHGLPELTTAKRIEHFRQSPYLVPVKIQDLVST